MLGAYLPFRLYLYEPLTKLFPRVIVYDYLERILQVGVKAMNEEIVALVKKEHPRYVIWTSWLYDIQESTLETIRNEGTTVIGWFFDDEWRFDDYSRWWISYLDYCVTNAVEAVPKYKALGARVIQTIPNTGTAIHRDWTKIEENYEVSFVGSRYYADRELWVEQLKNKNIPLHLFGNGWTEYVSFEDMLDIFKTSKINLNFSRTPTQNKLQIKGRMFQVCLAGGFLLTEYVPGIERYFEIGKEIVCFNNIEELTEKITYYLNNETERRSIAEAGWKKATNSYTSLHMISRVFTDIERIAKNEELHKKAKVARLTDNTQIRRLFSSHYLHWGIIFLTENYKDLWKDALALSISYNPFNLVAQGYRIIGFFPLLLRPTLLRLYQCFLKTYDRLTSRRNMHYF